MPRWTGPARGRSAALYRGRGDAGFWSRLGAAGLDWHLLPGVLFGTRTRLATPCMGSTIALHAETLAEIGGFPAFADVLADDYAIGAAIRAHGLKVAVPPMLVTHGCADASFSELWRHELRWAATIRGLAPLGYAGQMITMPLPLALLGRAGRAGRGGDRRAGGARRTAGAGGGNRARYPLAPAAAVDAAAPRSTDLRRLRRELLRAIG